MKNYIYENYGIRISKIYNDYFFIGDDKVLIFKTTKDEKYLNKLVDITNYLFEHNIMVNTFLINKKSNFYTKKDDYYIVLLKVNERENKIEYDDIKKYRYIPNDLERIDFKTKFEKEVDLIEKYAEDNSENKLINDSYNYFIGLCENSIQLLNDYKNIDYTIIHELNIYNKNEFNNPFNFIKGNYTYDLANYIKYNFFNNTLNYDELYEILIKVTNENDQVFLFSCLLFADYYLKAINNSKKIKFILKNVDNYKDLLIYCKNIYKNNVILTSINWLL